MAFSVAVVSVPSRSPTPQANDRDPKAFRLSDLGVSVAIFSVAIVSVLSWPRSRNAAEYSRLR